MDERFENEYIMMVHGWRMKNPERVAFAETAFKRLYWSGYKGRFGLYSWPTGWFEKPAHVYGIWQLEYLYGNEQNYGNSEVIARAAGAKLSNLLSDLNTDKSIHVFAHSMGNVVVSEALKKANGVQLMDHYVASQAAEVASSYSPLELFINHELRAGANVGCLESSVVGPEDAWRCYNINGLDTEYDMPPNYYSFVIPPLHGATSPALELQVSQQESWGDHYYQNISLAAGKIINFHNRADIALEGWEFNQLSKPDNLGGPTWSYDWEWDCPYSEVECLLDVYPDFEDGEQVTDIYTRAGVALQWTESNPIDTTAAEILAHIIPARTYSLGQRATRVGGSVIDSDVDLNNFDGFGADNQDHSAQYYSSFVERRGYWNMILIEFRLKDEEE